MFFHRCIGFSVALPQTNFTLC